MMNKKLVETKKESWGFWEDRSHMKNHPKAPAGLTRAYVNKVYSVQCFIELTDVGFVDHLMIRRHDGKPIHSWKDMQGIKCELVEDGEERIGVQVFPKQSEVVDQANMYHLWVYPKGHDLPFNLKKDSHDN